MDIESIYSNKNSYSMPDSIKFADTQVVSVDLKSSTLIGFNGMGKEYSITQPIFIKNSNGIEYRNAGDINIGDTLVSVDSSGNVSYIIVESIDLDDKQSVVYDIRTLPEPWFIVNSLVAIA